VRWAAWLLMLMLAGCTCDEEACKIRDAARVAIGDVLKGSPMRLHTLNIRVKRADEKYDARACISTDHGSHDPCTWGDVKLKRLCPGTEPTCWRVLMIAHDGKCLADDSYTALVVYLHDGHDERVLSCNKLRWASGKEDK
jgi:hypothetical protein